MKLFYWKSDVPNFGDQLNKWLWPRILPEGFFDTDERWLFLGMGTIINRHLPTTGQKVIFGSGVGYGRFDVPPLDTFRIYCVRGPRSAQALGIPSVLGVGDPATLVSHVYTSGGIKKHDVSFMPHIKTARRADWNAICSSSGVHYIDPRRAVSRILQEIDETRLLLAEAMHGAVVADAMRVPWIPVKSRAGILDFKWHDWTQSMGMGYEPYALPNLISDSYFSEHFPSYIHRRLPGTYAERPSLKRVASLAVSIARPIARYGHQYRVTLATRELAEIIQTGKALLSSDLALDTVTAQLLADRDRLVGDWEEGIFC